MTNVIALDDQDRFNEAIKERLAKSGARIAGRKAKATDYAADIRLEGLEGQFEEARVPAAKRGSPHGAIAVDLAIELSAWGVRRVNAWMGLGWGLASAQSFAAAAAQQIRFVSSALADCRETHERIRARLRVGVATITR
jgi:hypothetical protein